MLERIRTFAVISLIAVVAWLFAEAESLGEATLWARVDIVAPADRLLVQARDGWDRRVLVELRGAKGELNQAKAALEQGIPMEPGVTAGVPAVDGEHTVRLAEVLGSYEGLVATGVTVESTSPINVRLRVIELTTVSLPIAVVIPGIAVEGEVTVTPARAEVRLPRSVADELGDDVMVQATLMPDVVAMLPRSGSASAQAALSLPESLRSVAEVRLLTQRAGLSFSVRTALTTATLPVPVQVLLPSSEQAKWLVELEEPSQILNVSVRGPVEVVERLRSPEEGLVGVLALSSDELAGGIVSKTVGFAIVRGGVPGAVPETLTIEAEERTVRFRVTRLGTP